MLRSRLGDTNDGKHRVDQQHLFLLGRFLDMNFRGDRFLFMFFEGHGRSFASNGMQADSFYLSSPLDLEQ